LQRPAEWKTKMMQARGGQAPLACSPHLAWMATQVVGVGEAAPPWTRATTRSRLAVAGSDGGEPRAQHEAQAWRKQCGAGVSKGTR
jgi:hypothetical protein